MSPSSIGIFEASLDLIPPCPNGHRTDLRAGARALVRAVATGTFHYTRLFTMHDRHTPPARRPLYNVPMALEKSLTRTRGLEPELAGARNIKAVEDSKTYTLGPMPVHDFMKDFLWVPHPFDEVDLLSSRQAFSRVPTCASTVKDLCTHLVSGGVLVTMFTHELIPCADDSSEQADEEQVAMSRIYL